MQCLTSSGPVARANATTVGATAADASLGPTIVIEIQHVVSSITCMMILESGKEEQKALGHPSLRKEHEMKGFHSQAFPSAFLSHCMHAW